jgi:hypothetical protein
VYAQPQQVYIQVEPGNGLGVAGFVTGLLGVIALIPAIVIISVVASSS